MQQFLEPLEASELAFLEEKAKSEQRTYTVIFCLLMLMSLFFPFITSWYHNPISGSSYFLPYRFLFSALVLVAICCTGMVVVYRVFLRRLHLDIRGGQKTIRSHKIRKKVFVANGGTCHFFIDSSIKMSIEVTLQDFYRLSEGDEVFIEYAPHSKEYFGYY
jgi:uncharacterized membrane protein